MTELPFPKYTKPPKVKKGKAKKRKKRKKLRRKSLLIKDAWKVKSIYNRRKGADREGYVTCVTCSARLHYTEGDAGHYRHGHSKASFLEDDNINFQCRRCNHYLSGNLLNYHEYMLQTHGQGRIDEINALSKQIWKPNRTELEEIIAKYKEKVAALDKPGEGI